MLIKYALDTLNVSFFNYMHTGMHIYKLRSHCP